MELELKVEGMTCDGCSSRVADALKVLHTTNFVKRTAASMHVLVVTWHISYLTC